MRALRFTRSKVVAALATATLLTTGACPAAAEGWWPGGGSKEAEPAGETPSDDSAMVDSSMFKLSWPKVEMPKFSWKPGLGGGETPDAMTPEGNPVSRALDKVADSSKRAANNVRDAWGSAVSKLSFGGGDKATQTAQADKPGFWSRMFAPEEPQEARTVQEFLAQDRVGTTTR